MLTVAFVTNRIDCRLGWFLDSLNRETCGLYDGMSIVVVDYWHNERDGFASPVASYLLRTPPKPNVWNGPHRLTKENWFAAANQRNTALCLAPDGWIAYVDDLSVLMPGWLSRVRKAMAEGYIVCGAYKKMKGMVVEDGLVLKADEFAPDNRLKHRNDVAPCGGNWMYGCSLAAPVEAFLDINGWAESICDGLGFEDCCTGLVLRNAGYDLRYDPHMMTYESEELHHAEPPFRKDDWHFIDGKPVVGGNGGPDDKSHGALNIALKSKRFEYDVGGGFKDLRELRAHVLNGGEWPIRENPRHDWYTKLPLSEL